KGQGRENAGKSPEGAGGHVDVPKIDRYPHHGEEHRNKQVDNGSHALLDLFRKLMAVVVNSGTKRNEESASQSYPCGKGTENLRRSHTMGNNGHSENQ